MNDNEYTAFQEHVMRLADMQRRSGERYVFIGARQHGKSYANELYEKWKWVLDEQETTDHFENDDEDLFTL